MISNGIQKFLMLHTFKRLFPLYVKYPLLHRILLYKIVNHFDIGAIICAQFRGNEKISFLCLNASRIVDCHIQGIYQHIN